MKKLTKDILQRDAKRDIGASPGSGSRDQVWKRASFHLECQSGHRSTAQARTLTNRVRRNARRLRTHVAGQEQGRRQPSGAAKALLKVASASPNVVRKALKAA